MPAEYRVHTFVDFWNYTLSMKALDEKFRTDWKSLPKILTREATALIDETAQATYVGMNVYGSYDKGKQRDKGLYNWATTILDAFPGVNVHFKPRTKKKSFPSCPACHDAVRECPSCGVDMRGTEEKGVDTRLVTDLISYAWSGEFDIAVLVSSDQDFVPAAENLQNRGIKVIHASFPPSGRFLSQKCWGTVDVGKYRSEFKLK